MNKIRMAVGAALIVLGTQNSAHAQEGLNNQDKMFLKAGHQSDLSELMTSKLALQKTKNEKVRMIAQMIIKGHTMSLNERKPIAKTHSFALPQSPNLMQQAMYKKLTGLRGASFDKAYMGGQVKGHNAAVALFTKELGDGNDTHARSFAQKFLPDIQNHTSMIHNVASNLGIPVAIPKMEMRKGK